MVKHLSLQNSDSGRTVVIHSEDEPSVNNASRWLAGTLCGSCKNTHKLFGIHGVQRKVLGWTDNSKINL